MWIMTVRDLDRPVLFNWVMRLSVSLFSPLCRCGWEALSQVLKKNGDNNDSRRRVIGVAHEIITNSEETFAYEKGHYMNYSRDGEILSGGE